MKRINKNTKISLSIILAVAIQIALLINMTPASSYEISKTNNLFDQTKIKLDLREKILKGSLEIFLGFLTIKQIARVSAQEAEFNCCLETKQEELCVDFVRGSENNCKTDLVGSECKDISSCEIGCCIDKDEGLCTERVTRQNCANSGGEWLSEENCAISECQKGCCVLGDETKFVEDSRCGRLAELFGFEKNFVQQIGDNPLESHRINEFECLVLGASAEKSACLFEGNRCEFLTETECITKRGNYREGFLCSAEELNTTCEKQDSIGCIVGKDEIYWFDSCGNSENIYSSDRDESWNFGRVLSKEQSCGANSANINSQDCGNCFYLGGSICSEVGITERSVIDGNFICKDLDCIDENGRERKNGESWCVYDGFIGEGKDVVGSRHWKRMCIDGEVIVEPCADYRGQVCVQSNVEDPTSGEIFESASCVLNEATACIAYNSDQETVIENCEKNNMCYVNNVNVDEGFRFDICAPQYPKGSDLSYEEGNQREAGLCSIASQKCTMIFEKKADHPISLSAAFGGIGFMTSLARAGYECVYNCDCAKQVFSDEMNDLCISMGDCGSYINIDGKGTDNVNLIKAKPVKWEDYSQYAEPVEGQFAKPKNISEALLTHRNPVSPDGPEPLVNEDLVEGLNIVGGVVGGSGLLVGMVGTFMVNFDLAGSFGFGLMQSTKIALFGPSVAESAVVEAAFANNAAAANLAAESAVQSSLGGNLLAIGQSLAVSSLLLTASQLLTMAFGLEGQAATIMTVAGATTAVYYFVTTQLLGVSGACGPFAVICLVVLVIIAGLLKLFGIGDTKQVVVSFDCLPWEAPTGADDCSKCNENDLKPCTKYRCESLGQACKLLNENTDNPSCEKVPNDNIPPKITPSWIGAGYNFANSEQWSIELEKSTGGCVPEFTTVLFGLDTHEPAQCKYDFVRKDTYEEMENYPLELNAYLSNHSFGIMMPSLDSLNEADVSGDIRRRYANMSMYVRCQDYYGDVNTREYIIRFCVETGPDITPAYIAKYDPLDQSYISYEETEKSFGIYLNEPAECKYDLEDKEYSQMSEDMTCNLEVNQFETAGWPCKTNLTNLNSDKTIYIKCKDQPWFKNTANESQRNINTNGFPYTLYKSKSELKIDLINPEGNLETGFVPMAVDFEVRTSGGAENGKAVCYYNFEDYKKNKPFRDSYSNIHYQNINQLMAGDYRFYVLCEDVAGNIAKDFVDIEVNLDDEIPIVVRAFKERGELNLITDEKSECVYSNTKCLYDFNNGTSMTLGYSKEHKTKWESGKTYYVKCRDVWGNAPNECSIKLLPSFFFSLILNKFIKQNIV
jgi:hypothetical protein